MPGPRAPLRSTVALISSASTCLLLLAGAVLAEPPAASARPSVAQLDALGDATALPLPRRAPAVRQPVSRSSRGPGTSAISSDLRDTGTAGARERVLPALHGLPSAQWLPWRADEPSLDTWWRLALCESNGNPRAVSRHGTYHGLFQFDARTWAWVGMSGDPVDHTPEQQLLAARRLWRLRGFVPWPTCGRRLGLLPPEPAMPARSPSEPPASAAASSPTPAPSPGASSSPSPSPRASSTPSPSESAQRPSPSPAAQEPTSSPTPSPSNAPAPTPSSSPSGTPAPAPSPSPQPSSAGPPAPPSGLP